MKVSSNQLASSFDDFPELNAPNTRANLVLVHGNPYSLEQPRLLENLCKGFPNASIAGCSSAGEILNGETYQNSIIYSAIEFEHSTVRQTRVNLNENKEDEFEAGKELAKKLLNDDLVAVLVFSEGLIIDCDQLIKGAVEVFGNGVHLIGGLAADNSALQYTVVVDREGVYDNAVIAIGLYGKRLKVNNVTSTFDNAGVEIDISSSEGNIIHQINQQPALGVYENIIFQQSGLELNSILSHPLIILDAESKRGLYCRTISGVDVENGTLSSAGSIPEGPAKLISLINADDIFENTTNACACLNDHSAEFAFVVSCAGRKDAMGIQWIRESSIIQKSLGETPNLGFYSYGEIGQSNPYDPAVVHNHTLTIATFIET